MSEKKTVTLQIPVPISLAQDIKNLAKLDERSMAVYCKRALQAHVEDVLGINTKEMQMEEIRKNFIGNVLAINDNSDSRKDNEVSDVVNTVEIKKTETKNKKRPGKMVVGL